ncbi:hypothetical protein [uncultured Shewanella sp.]|uniref:hypothetical protein n=1 Tax=uncultured Shewanella sp. TaxID=173975 RepID=UPI002601FBF0|nr:hypothetical protein [uncultured Shewanella sp.]
MQQGKTENNITGGKICAQKEDCDLAPICDVFSVLSTTNIDSVVKINALEPWQISFEKPVTFKQKQEGLYLAVLLVGMLHIALFFCIDKLWQQNVDNRRTKVTTKETIKSYLYVSPLPKSEVVTTSDSKGGQPQVNDPTFTNKMDVMTKSSAINLADNTSMSRVTMQQEVKSEGGKRTLKNSAKGDKPIPQSVLNNPANLTSKVNAKVSPAEKKRFRFDDLDPSVKIAQHTEGLNTNIINGTILDEKTLSYLQQQNDSKLNDLVVKTELPASNIATLSDMTPKMEALNSPIATLNQTARLPQVHGHLQDPNRIVQKGDYCYRMIKTPTQMNPNAEIVATVGYRCSPDEDKKNVQNLINQRLKQHDAVIN